MAFKINLSGQVNEIRLPVYKALWPLFETIINSIQSLEDSSNKDCGEIVIYAERLEPKIIDLNGEEKQSTFKSFTITDNGDGFNSDNFNSFMEAYSDYKISKGCKGIGRFLWLKAFDNVHIRSNFFENEKWQKREFDFNITNAISPEENVIISNDDNYCTEINLVGYVPKYRNHISVNLKILAKRIIEHCLPYFLNSNCPKLILKDSDGEIINLNEYFENTIKDNLHQDSITIKDHNFHLYHIFMNEGADKHELHFCANNREVKSYDLSKLIPDLQKKINNGEQSYYYVGYLSGEYLDKKVNSNRTEFTFEDENLVDAISQEELENNIIDHIKTYLSEDIAKIKENKIITINNFVKSQKPQYRYLLNNRPQTYDRIPAGLSDDKLEIELHKYTQEWEHEILKQGKEIDNNIKDNIYSSDDYIKIFNDYCKAISEISRISLSEYVIRRKAILELLEKALELNNNEKYNSEASIHSIICPMRITSDDVEFEEMNLWIIDDRLAYHDFLASDKMMKTLPVLDTQIDKRMDIAVFDTAMSFSSNKDVLNSISIIELKKPQRNDLSSDDKNPITQVLNYVSDIRSGKAKKTNGRDFGPVDNTAFYCYIIADLTSSLIEDAENASLTQTPDKMGYYGYNPAKHAYIEVISYDKLVKDAKQRNQILFDKLFQPNINQIIHKNE